MFLETRLRSLLESQGGFTYSPKAGRFFGKGSQGYVVVSNPERCVQAKNAKQQNFRDFINANRDLFDTGKLFGGWRDPETGITHFDVAIIVATEQEALFIGEQNNQTAIHDLANGVCIPVRQLATA